MKEKASRGITLIALVVTIIVLLILAGVSISVLTGENGLLNRAGQAKEQSKIAQFEEQIKLAYNDAIIASAVSGNGAKVNIGDWMFSMIDSGANIIPEETDTPNEYLITIDGEDDLYVFNANSKKLSKYEKEFSDDWYKDYTYTTDDTANTITLIDYTGTDKVTYIGKSAKIGSKEYTTVLEGHLDSNQNPTSIFQNTDVTKVKLQNGITEIGTGAFYGVANFKSLVIPNGVQHIVQGALNGPWTELKMVYIPSSVGYDNDDNPNNDAVAFGFNNSKLETLVVGAKKINSGSSVPPDIAKIKFLEGVQTIEMGSFWNLSKIKRLEFPKSIKEINYGAFQNCTGLEEIKIGAQIIGGSSFYNSPNLKKVELLDGVEELSGGAFNSCPSLTEIVIPNTITNIQMGVFDGLVTSVKTTIYTTSEIAKNYDWVRMNREVVFK